jgi:hypothetical protein
MQGQGRHPSSASSTSTTLRIPLKTSHFMLNGSLSQANQTGGVSLIAHHSRTISHFSSLSFSVAEVDNTTCTTEPFGSDETIAIPDDQYQSPPTSPTQFNKRAADHPTQLFQFPSPPAYSAPPNPTSHLLPIATGSTSELFQCVIKKPDVVELEINGELQSNVHDVRQQFLAELRIYRTVTRHRNIVAFLGCLEGLGMVLEYVDGSPLLDVIRNPQAPLSPETKIDFHDQLLDGLAHIHSFGLSHGDLSLLNVHVSKHYQTLKILDFGRSTMSKTHSYPHHLYETSFLPQPPAKRIRSSYNSSGPPTPTVAYPLSPTRSYFSEDHSHSHSHSHSHCHSHHEPEPEVIHPGTRPFTAPEIIRGECTDPILADAYSFGMILLCLDHSQLVDVDPAHQRKDGEIDCTGCELFGERIKNWYTKPWWQRRLVKVEDRMGGYP